MSEWKPVTQPPQSVGPCLLNDIFGHTHRVQWDGRHFRYAEGQFAGRVVVHYKGDLWRLQSNETKEAEMLNEHDLQDMRPDEPGEWNERADALIDEWMRPAFSALEAFCAASQPKEPR